MDNKKIYITGGSGSGTSTLGRELEKLLGIKYFDTDDFFHKPTDPPFQEQYSKDERNSLLLRSLEKHDSWIVSGSVSTWDIESFNFTHGIFLNPGSEERISRLKKRERERFGDRLDPGGDMYQAHLEFIEWAKGYEMSLGEGRTQKIEEAFLDSRGEKVLKINDNFKLNNLIEKIKEFIK